jgi:hypothetical protein
MPFCQGLRNDCSLGNNPGGFHRCDHLEPKLLIAIKDQEMRYNERKIITTIILIYVMTKTLRA